MDESVSKESENQTTTPSYSAVMGRALVSAGVFGALGAWLGSWLGRRGGAEGSKMTDGK